MVASIASLSAHLVAYRQCVISLAAPGVSKLIAPLARGEAQRYCHPARENSSRSDFGSAGVIPFHTSLFGGQGRCSLPQGQVKLVRKKLEHVDGREFLSQRSPLENLE
jgi:hypothetical protein